MERYTPEEMDAFMVEARDELTMKIDAWTASELTAFHRRWVMKCGHRRLGREYVSWARHLEVEQEKEAQHA